MVKINWKIKLAIILLIASAILYTIAYFGFNEPDKVLFYIVIDLAFIPLDILIVALVIESIIEKKEKETIHEKLDMILGVFFSEIGNDLLETLSKVNNEKGEIDKIEHIDRWDDKDFKIAYNHLKNNRIQFKPNLKNNDEIKEFIIKLNSILNNKRCFLTDLLENPNLIEKDSFSNLLLAIFHLNDELSLRTDLDRITEVDFAHIVGDIDRVYCRLTYEWLKYLQFLKKHYPYMSSITIRRNPFNPDRCIYIEE